MPGDEALFRRQAIAALRTPPYGRPVAPAPRSWRSLLVLLAVTAAAAGVFAARADYTRSATVRGWLVAGGGAVRIAHPAAGRVAAVLSQPGARVAAGETLLVLAHDATPAADIGSGLRRELSLGEELRALERRGRMALDELALERSALQRRIRQRSLERDLLQRRQRAQRRRVDLAAARSERLARAALRGAVAELELLTVADSLVAARQGSVELDQRLAAANRELDELQDERARLELRHAMAAVEHDNRRLAVERQRGEVRSARRSVIAAPLAGTLATVEATPGATVGANALLATLLPAGSRLHAELYVPSRAVGFIAAGQPVRLRLDAFPHRRYGVVRGTVKYVSGTVLLPQELPVRMPEPVYRVRVALATQYVRAAHGRRHRLLSGMAVDATVVLDRQPLLRWLLAPLSAQRTRPGPEAGA